MSYGGSRKNSYEGFGDPDYYTKKWRKEYEDEAAAESKAKYDTKDYTTGSTGYSSSTYGDSSSSKYGDYSSSKYGDSSSSKYGDSSSSKYGDSSSSKYDDYSSSNYGDYSSSKYGDTSSSKYGADSSSSWNPSAAERSNMLGSLNAIRTARAKETPRPPTPAKDYHNGMGWAQGTGYQDILHDKEAMAKAYKKAYEEDRYDGWGYFGRARRAN